MTFWKTLLPAGLGALLLVTGCQQTTNTVIVAANPSGKCLDCHANSAAGAQGALTGAPLTAQTQLAASGHENGLRHLSSAGTETWSTTTFGETSSGCSKCHTDAGFTSWVTNGPGAQASTTDYAAMANTSITVTAATNPFTCFTCHNPHATYAMDLSTAKQVLLPSGMGTNSYTSTNSFDGGKGNLCVNCHQDRTTPNALMKTQLPAAAADVYLSISRTEHHGVQGDFLQGADSAGATAAYAASGPGVYAVAQGGAFTLLGATAVTYNGTAGGGYLVGAAVPTFAKSVHLTSNVSTTVKVNAGPTDSCVTCHVDLNTAATGETSPHGMYLSTGTTDNVAACAQCHTGSFTYTPTGGTATTYQASSTNSGVAIAATVGASTFSTTVTGPKVKLTDVLAAEQTLLTYFGNPVNFHVSKASGAAALANTNPAPIISANLGSVTIAPPSGAGSLAVGTAALTYVPAATTDDRLNRYSVDWATSYIATDGNSYSGAVGVVSNGTTSATNYMTSAQAQAFWNLMLFEEDRSKGVHNPLFAAQILYDAVNLLSQTQPAAWAARPSTYY